MATRVICPVCDGTGSDRCLHCPVCGKPITWFQQEGWDSMQCPHILAWGTIGDGEVYWESGKYQEMFDKFVGRTDDEDDDIGEYDIVEEALEAFAQSEGLHYYTISDGMPHGHSTGGYYLFMSKAPAKKRATPKKAKKSTPRTGGRKALARGRRRTA